ncbi:MAG TPA: hypothetical protein VJ743_14855 [Albitalea sp.]|nr:hypothetical protein [Albitalea sp.]
MPCIESKWLRGALGAAVLLSACSSPMPSGAPSPGATAPHAGAARGAALGAPGSVRSMSEVRLQAARRMVAANPGGTYTGTVPDILLAIPVLEVELNGDGSIRRIEVLRRPGQAPETLQMAIEAMRRAAPFGDVSRLPKPWKFSETFLFNDERKFKPRTLDN